MFHSTLDLNNDKSRHSHQGLGAGHESKILSFHSDSAALAISPSRAAHCPLVHIAQRSTPDTSPPSQSAHSQYKP